MEIKTKLTVTRGDGGGDSRGRKEQGKEEKNTNRGLMGTDNAGE